MEVPGLPDPPVGLPEFALAVGLGSGAKSLLARGHSSGRCVSGEMGLWPRPLGCAQFPTQLGRQRALTDVSVHAS